MIKGMVVVHMEISFAQATIVGCILVHDSGLHKVTGGRMSRIFAIFSRE